MRKLDLATVRAEGSGWPVQTVMSPPAVSPGLGMSSFGICHDSFNLVLDVALSNWELLVPQALQRLPSRIHIDLITVTRLGIAIRTAGRAESLTALAAQASHGYVQL